MEKLDRFLHNTESVVEFLAGIGCFVLMIAVVTEVLSRYVLKTILITGLFNITETYIFPFFTFLAFAGSYRVNLWPKLDILANHMTFSTRRILELFILFIELTLWGMAMYFTMIYAYKMTLEGRLFGAGSLQYPLYPILWLVPFCLFLLCMEIVLSMWKWKNR
jgi:TRAP-type C4-dicarboxylate transport system permease small subunit